MNLTSAGQTDKSAGPAVSVVIPTYREAENIRLLLPRIAEAMRTARLSHEILVVDDDSRDGIDAVVSLLADSCGARLISRTENRDLSLAVLEGLRAARGESLVVMDADGSHPPECIADLLAALNSPSVDFTLGSRFVSGGATRDWGGDRRLNSYVATLLARPLARGISDPMAGFFALRRETFERATDLNPIGYKIGLELICRCRCRQVAEIPIVFQNRVRGQSKLNVKQQIRYLIHLDRLYRDFARGWGLLVRPVLWLMLGILSLVRLLTGR